MILNRSAETSGFQALRAPEAARNRSPIFIESAALQQTCNTSSAACRVVMPGRAGRCRWRRPRAGRSPGRLPRRGDDDGVAAVAPAGAVILLRSRGPANAGVEALVRLTSSVSPSIRQSDPMCGGNSWVPTRNFAKTPSSTPSSDSPTEHYASFARSPKAETSSSTICTWWAIDSREPCPRPSPAASRQP